MPQHHRGDTSCFWRPSAQTIPEGPLCTSGHERIPSADGSNLFTPPIILLQTVIEEVRHRSLPLYNRLKAVIKTEEKRVWVFYNEYRSSVNVLSSSSILTLRDVERQRLFAKMERAQMIVMTEVSNLFTSKKLWLRLWTGIRKA